MIDLQALPYRAAAERIGRSRRSIERLVRSGVLKTTGTGQHKRVTVESLNEYRRQTNHDKTADNSLSMSAVSKYQRTVKRILKDVRPLTSTRDAADRLGIPVAEIEAMVASNSIPSIPIGPRRYIPAFWLVATLAQATGASPR